MGPCCSHGIPMGFKWVSHRPAVFPSDFHGIPTGFSWTSRVCGSHMGLPGPRGVSMGCPWDSHWTLMGHSYGRLLLRPWADRGRMGALILRPCSHGTPMEFPWAFIVSGVSRGIPMGSPWARSVPMGCLLDSHWTPMGVYCLRGCLLNIMGTPRDTMGQPRDLYGISRH